MIQAHPITRTQIDYFLALVRHGQFAAAAEGLHISQPALSMQIQRLEELTGGALIDRKSRPLRLTPKGEELIPHLREIQAAFVRLESLLQQQDQEVHGQFRLAAIPTIAPYVLPASISGFVEKYPSVTLDVEELPTQMLLTALREERIDAGVIALPAKESLEGLTYTVLWAESLWAYHQPNASQAVFTPAQLQQWPLYVLTEGHCLRDHVVGLCGQKDSTSGGMNFQAGSLDTLMRLVDQHGGMTVIPDMARAHLPDVKKAQCTSPISTQHARREIVLVTNPSMPYAANISAQFGHILRPVS